MGIMLKVFVAVLLFLPQCQGVGCPSDDLASTYLRSEGLRLMEVAKARLKDVTLNACAKSCTENAKEVQCESFEYDPRVQECSLHARSGQPFGPSILARTDAARAFFQQICLPAANLCPTPYAFERYPQHVLYGNSLEVISVEGGLSECLNLCLDATKRFGIQCRSVIFYYTSNECILNRETRVTAAHLFSPVTDDTLVDYFENNCYDVVCPSSSSGLHWLRSEEFAIGHDKDLIIESMTIDDCRRLCTDNGVSGEIFPCKAFVFSSSKEECHLSAESGILKMKQKGFELSPISSGEYYEKTCLRSAYQCKESSFELVPNKQLVNVTVKTIETSSINTCLEACLNERETCSAVTFNYDLDECYLHSESQYTTPGNFQVGKRVDYFDKICDYLPDRLPIEADGGSALPPTSPQHDDAPTDETTPRNPFPTLAVEDEETPSAITSTSHSTPHPPSLAPTHANAVEEPFDPEHPPSIPSIPASTQFHGDNPSEDENADQRVTDDVLENSVIPEGHAEEGAIGVFAATQEKVKAQMTTECRLSGISLIVDFAQDTSGAIFVQEAFGTCKVVFKNSSSATLHIPYPKADEPNPKCPGEEIRPGFWSFVIVVQRNDLNAPSLMTSNDRVFNVTCDYSAVDDDAMFLQPEDEPSSSSSPHAKDVDESRSKHVKMSILQGNTPISNVGLGDEVEIRWTITTDVQEKLGYFINECIAERIGGTGPEPEPLKLIFDGCPEVSVRNRLMRYPVVQIPDGFSTKMKVFRFDGSRKVRIRCIVDVCVEQCPPVLCETESSEDGTTSEVQSFGRRKKRAMMNDIRKMMTKLRPEFVKNTDQNTATAAKKARIPSHLKSKRRRSITSGTISIFDKQVPPPADLIQGKGAQERLQTADYPVCLSKPMLFSSVSVVAVVGVLQLFFLLNVWRRRNGDGSSADSHCSSSDNTSYTASSSSSQYRHSSLPSTAISSPSHSPHLNASYRNHLLSSGTPGPTPPPRGRLLVHEYAQPRQPPPPPHQKRTDSTLF